MSQTEEVGYVVSNKHFLVYLDGMPTAHINDMVISDNGVRGWVSSLLPEQVEISIIDDGEIVPGQMFKKLPNKLSVNVGEFLLGRAINPLGVPIDGKGLFGSKTSSQDLPLENPAPGIHARQFITNQFITGVTLIDTLIPLGKGQRELVLGDSHSGKTSFLIDMIVNQRDTSNVCVYASIGKPAVEVRNLIDILNFNHALDYTVIIGSTSSEPLPQIFLTPKTAFTVAEYFQKQGKDVLLILDDLGSHAKIYREISLLSAKPPGRESYPGDIFYQHSHLLERAGNFKAEFGGGSITALPVVEISLSDLTGFIPTNVMSMTDGHLLFKQSLHNIGQQPAIDISLSVSRVGSQTQLEVQNHLAARIKEILGEAESLETVSRFSSILPPETQLILNQRLFIQELLNQERLVMVPQQVQIIILCLPFTSFLRDKSVEYLKTHKRAIVDAFLSDFDLSTLTSTSLKFRSEVQLIEALEKLVPKLNQLFPK